MLGFYHDAGAGALSCGSLLGSEQDSQSALSLAVVTCSQSRLLVSLMTCAVKVWGPAQSPLVSFPEIS